MCNKLSKQLNGRGEERGGEGGTPAWIPDIPITNIVHF